MIPVHGRCFWLMLRGLALVPLALTHAHAADTSSTSASPAAPAVAAPKVKVEQLKRGTIRADGGNLFQSKNWNPPPPPKKSARKPAALPQPVALPPPQAPPLPYTYIGRLIDDGQAVVFLTRQEKNLVVRVGDTLENTYHVDEITADQLVLTHLQFKQQQTLSLGANRP